MSATFTSISAGLDWQHVDFLNELVGAWSERRQAIGQSAVDDVAAGDDIQAVTFWKAMQDWIEDECDNFFNHDDTIEGASSVPMFDVAGLRTAAGLNASGFRRATVWEPDTPPDWETDVSFSYGKMQAGDIIGPWIFDDLQKAFDALRWTTKNPTSKTGNFYFGSGLGNDFDEAKTACLADWEDTGTHSDDYDIVFYVPSSYPDAMGGSRKDAQYTVSSIPTMVSHTADFASKFGASATGSFYDYDGVAGTEDLYSVWHSFTSASASSRAAYIGGNLGVCPVELYSASGTYGIKASGTVLVLKWDFEYHL